MSTTRWMAALALAMLVGPAYAQAPTQPPTQPPAGQESAFKTDKEKVSYSIGVNMGKSLASGMKQQSFEVDTDTLVKGLRDALAGGKLVMSDAEMRDTMTKFVSGLQAKAAEAAQKAAAGNEKEGQAFLAANKSKPGVVTTASGLQYKVLKAGTGKKPTNASTVTVNYVGKLLNGTEFDSSAKHGQAATFQVGGVIPGWSEALKLMPVGSKYQLWIPAKLAYGERGTPDGTIPPGSTLTFEVELLSIK